MKKVRQPLRQAYIKIRPAKKQDHYRRQCETEKKGGINSRKASDTKSYDCASFRRIGDHEAADNEEHRHAEKSILGVSRKRRQRDLRNSLCGGSPEAVMVEDHGGDGRQTQQVEAVDTCRACRDARMCIRQRPPSLRKSDTPGPQ